MRWSYRIGSLAGFPIRIHVSLLVFLGFVFFTGGGVRGLILMIAVFASVVAHEVGHAMVARVRGMPIVDISLYPFGGMARMAAPPETTGDEIKVAVAGPAVSLLLALGLGVSAWLTKLPTLWLLAQINLMLGLFNLLPALPMDGGRILRAWLARKMGYYRATSVSARLARWLALGVALAGLVVSGWLVLLAAFLYLMSLAEEASARARQYMGDPGYQDAPRHTRPVLDPFHRFAEGLGFKVSGSDWEVLNPDEPGPGNREAGRKVYRDRHGNRIVVEWRDGS